MSEREEYDEEKPKRRRLIRCSDRMCGATDCPTCFPGNFWPGRHGDEGEEKDEE